MDSKSELAKFFDRINAQANQDKAERSNRRKSEKFKKVYIKL
jgi:hypothetical protein